MPFTTITLKASLYTYIKDWQSTDGRWVYVPVSNSTKNKLNPGFRNLLAANALRQASRLISHVTLAAKVDNLAREYAGNIVNKLLGTWEDNDPICPSNWPFLHWPPLPQTHVYPELDPIFHATSVLAGISNKLPLLAKNELVGFTLQLIGETLHDKHITMGW
jgi:hypothetical protein